MAENANVRRGGQRAGWAVVSGGVRYLATDRGWLELVDNAGLPFHHPDLRDGRSLRVSGRPLDDVRFLVEKIDTSSAGSSTAPRFVTRPPTSIYRASEARLAVDRFLAEAGYPQVFLPAMWLPSREYGEDEFEVSYCGDPLGLVLLQSSELPMFALLAEGVERFQSWTRCFRHESERSPQHLIEFEQLVFGSSHTTLDEIMDLTEAIVSVVAASLGVPATPPAWRSAEPPWARATESAVEIPSAVPVAAVKVLQVRLEALGAVVSIETHPDGQALVVRGVAAEHSATAEAYLASARRIFGAAGANDVSLRWWAPLPRRWLPEEESASAHPIRSITAAMIEGGAFDGSDAIDEAELFLNGAEVAHAGIFADTAGLIRNLEDASAPVERYGWLVDRLESAPPLLATVGIGWERLIGALLGEPEIDALQAYPKPPSPASGRS